MLWNVIADMPWSNEIKSIRITKILPLISDIVYFDRIQSGLWDIVYLVAELISLKNKFRRPLSSSL